MPHDIVLGINELPRLHRRQNLTLRINNPRSFGTVARVRLNDPLLHGIVERLVQRPPCTARRCAASRLPRRIACVIAFGDVLFHQPKMLRLQPAQPNAPYRGLDQRLDGASVCRQRRRTQTRFDNLIQPPIQPIFQIWSRLARHTTGALILQLLVLQTFQRYGLGASTRHQTPPLPRRRIRRQLARRPKPSGAFRVNAAASVCSSCHTTRIFHRVAKRVANNGNLKKSKAVYSHLRYTT